MSRYKCRSISTIRRTGIRLGQPEFTTENLKYADIDFAINNTNQYVKDIIKSAPIEGNHKYIVVDVKTHILKEGQIPALPFWHFDCVCDPRDNSREEVHHIFITDGCNTEFLKHEAILDLEDAFNPVSFNKKYQDILIGEEIEPYCIYTYRRHLHRATKAKKNCKRLLIRVSETDNIRPQNLFFKETYR
jgi:hypothetical protein